MGKPLCCQRMQSRRSRAISSLRWSLNSQTRVIARVISTRDITLITGANKGLGYETARRLIDLGHTVLVGARDPRRGTQAAHELGGVYVEIDPADDDSGHAAAARVRDDFGHLDVLINNAGTAAPRPGDARLETGRRRRRYRHLLLRSTLSVAARHERERQCLAAPVLPKGTGLSVHSAEHLDWVAQELNDRPRKRLAFNKPIELIGDLLLR